MSHDGLLFLRETLVPFTSTGWFSPLYHHFSCNLTRVQQAHIAGGSTMSLPYVKRLKVALLSFTTKHSISCVSASVCAHPPVPHADGHVVLISHRHDVAAVGGERHAGYPIFMGLNFSHLSSAHLPHPHTGHVTALKHTQMMYVVPSCWGTVRSRLDSEILLSFILMPYHPSAINTNTQFTFRNGCSLGCSTSNVNELCTQSEPSTWTSSRVATTAGYPSSPQCMMGILCEKPIYAEITQWHLKKVLSLCCLCLRREPQRHQISTHSVFFDSKRSFAVKGVVVTQQRQSLVRAVIVNAE